MLPQLEINQNFDNKSACSSACILLTCTEPGNVPGQNYVDLEAVVCWLNWDWKAAPVNLVPAHKETKQRRQKGDKSLI